MFLTKRVRHVPSCATSVLVPTGGLSCVHALHWPVGVGDSVLTARSRLHLCLRTGTLATGGRRVVTGVFAVAIVFNVLPLAGLGRGKKLEVGHQLK